MPPARSYTVVDVDSHVYEPTDIWEHYLDRDYRVIALDYVDQNEWNDPDFLERIRSKATAFSINEGEAKSIDLRITTAS